jgi:hypothetical protein
MSHGMAEWPEPNERGKLECPDCHSEFTNPVSFTRHDCYPDVRLEMALSKANHQMTKMLEECANWAPTEGN